MRGREHCMEKEVERLKMTPLRNGEDRAMWLATVGGLCSLDLGKIRGGEKEVSKYNTRNLSVAECDTSFAPSCYSYSLLPYTVQRSGVARIC